MHFYMRNIFSSYVAFLDGVINSEKFENISIREKRKNSKIRVSDKPAQINIR